MFFKGRLLSLTCLYWDVNHVFSHNDIILDSVALHNMVSSKVSCFLSLMISLICNYLASNTVSTLRF